MSGYNIEYFIKDFAERTRYNLEYIERYQEKEGPFEITQLINSLFGLIVLPVEEYKGRKLEAQKGEENDFDQAKKDIKGLMIKCANEKRYRSTYSDVNNPVGFLKHIRNAVSHAGKVGIHFIPLTEEEKENITGIIFYDHISDTPSEFCVELNIQELKLLLDNATILYSCAEKKDGKKLKYEMAVEEMRKFLSGTERDKTIGEIVEERYNASCKEQGRTI